jgi:hypothetical protein
MRILAIQGLSAGCGVNVVRRHRIRLPDHGDEAHPGGLTRGMSIPEVLPPHGFVRVGCWLARLYPAVSGDGKRDADEEDGCQPCDALPEGVSHRAAFEERAHGADGDRDRLVACEGLEPSGHGLHWDECAAEEHQREKRQQCGYLGGLGVLSVRP